MKQRCLSRCLCGWTVCGNMLEMFTVWRNAQFSSVAQSCPTLFDLMNCSTPGLHVHHQLWWCHPTTSSSVVPFSSCLQSFPESRSFPMSQLFALGGHSIGSASASVLLMNTQGLFPLALTGLIFLQSKGLSTAPQFERINSLELSLLYGPTLTSIHDYWKNSELWPYGPLLVKWYLCFLICCLALLSRSKCLLIDMKKKQVKFIFK